MAKAKSLAEQMQELPGGNGLDSWSKLTPGQQQEIGEMIRVWWELPLAQRKSKKAVRDLICDYLGHEVGVTTVKRWFDDWRPNG